MEITHNTFSLPEGRVGYAIFRDISEQIEREQEISEQKRRYESLFHSVSGAVVVTDLDGTITTCNPGFTDLFGYGSDDIEGTHLRTILRTDTDIGCLLESQTENRESLVVDYRKKSGQLFPGESRSSPLRTHSDSISGHVVHIVDVSEAQENREQLQVLSRIFRHNVKNDMNVVLGHAELIRDRGSNEMLPHAEKLLQTSQKFVEMAENQHRIAKLLTENPQTVAVYLAPTLRQVVADVRTQYPLVTLETNLGTECRASTTGKVGEAILELVQNAIVHSDQERTSVDIHLQSTETMIELMVRDNGPGIPDQELDVLTADVEISALCHGTGLGLWFVNQIVRRSNGTLSFDTNDSGGTTVTVHLPAVQSLR